MQTEGTFVLMKDARDPELIDLRSDVVSQATQEQLEAMCSAEVGDDFYGDDPTAQLFQKTIAEYFGFQAALLVPSTTMGNLISVLNWTHPGDEVIVWGHSHAIDRQSAGMCLIGGVQTRQIISPSGVLQLDQIRKRVRKESDHLTFPSTNLIMIENPSFDGEVWPLENLENLRAFSKQKEVKIHCDGARILNAVAHYGISPKQIGGYFDSMTFCLSKGMCCPFGSVILSDAKSIKHCMRLRKGLGGCMRQVGIICGGGLQSLKTMPQVIQEDNRIAKYLGDLLSKIPQVAIDCSKIQVNMVNFSFKEQVDHKKLQQHLAQKSIKIKPYNPEKSCFKMVVHRQIRETECETVVAAVRDFLTQQQPKQ